MSFVKLSPNRLVLDVQMLLSYRGERTHKSLKIKFCRLPPDAEDQKRATF